MIKRTFEGFEAVLHVDPATGHAAFAPTPGPEILDRYYNGQFSRSDNPTPENEFTDDVVEVMRNVVACYREACALPEHFSFHDVGCGFGAGVWAMQRLGMRASGNELNAAWMAAANPHCNGMLSAGTLEEALGDVPRDIDAFFSAHVLEHLADPLGTLRTIAKHMAPQGALLLCLPNALCEKVLVYGREADPALFFPMHLNYFSPASLALFLRRAGLEPAIIETRPLDGVIDATRPESACEALLGGELFAIAVRPENTIARRDPDIDVKCAAHLSRFSGARAAA